MRLTVLRQVQNERIFRKIDCSLMCNRIAEQVADFCFERKCETDRFCIRFFPADRERSAVPVTETVGGCRRWCFRFSLTAAPAEQE